MTNIICNTCNTEVCSPYHHKNTETLFVLIIMFVAVVAIYPISLVGIVPSVPCFETIIIVLCQRALGKH